MPFVDRTDSKLNQHQIDVKKLFIGRNDELIYFIKFILEPDKPSHNIISIWGQGGVGKSTLLARFMDEAQNNNFKDYCLTALVNDHQTTPANVMEKFADQLNIEGDFKKALIGYKEALKKLKLEREAARENFWRKTTEDLAGAVVKDVPIVGGLLEKGAGPAIGYFFDEIHNRQLLKDAEKLEDPIGDLTQAFVEELNKYAESQIIQLTNRQKRRPRIVLFFDTFEQLAAETVPWLLNHFLQANISNSVVLIVAGRDPIDRSNPDYIKEWLPYYDDNTIYSISLSSFTIEETGIYLAERGITNVTRVNTIWQLSHGLPFYLSLLTSNPQREVDPTEDVVANILHWIPEQEKIKRQLALDAALLSKPFNQDDLEAFLYLPQDKDERLKLYNWLIGQPFIHSDFQEGRYNYHDLAQDLFSRYLYRRSQKEYYTTRQALANYYQMLLNRYAETKSTEYSAEWLTTSLALSYQLFLLPEETNHILAIAQILKIYQQTKHSGEIFRILNQISSEKPNNQANTNARQDAKQLLQFIKAEESNQAQKLVTATNYLLSKIGHNPNFPTEQLFFIYRERGQAALSLKKYAQAVTEFEKLITLNRNDAIAYHNKGLAHYHLEDYQKAIDNYNRSFELGLKTARLYHNRGSVYMKLKDYKKAIENYDQAFILDDKFNCAFSHRGEAYFYLKRYRQVIAELKSAITLDSQSAVLYSNRGLAYYHLNQYQRAIEDFDRAIELDATQAGFYHNRGLAYFYLKEYEKALVDCNQSIVLDSQDARSIDLRGDTYSKLNRYIEALADYNLVIKLEPNNPDAFTSRAYFYYKVGRAKEALNDFDHSIKLDSSFRHSAERGKGLVFHSLHKYLEATQAFYKALVDLPACESCLTSLALAYKTWHLQDEAFNLQHVIIDQISDISAAKASQLLNSIDYQEIIDHYAQAIKLNPEDSKAIVNRGATYHMMGYQNESLTDLERALDLDKSISGTIKHMRALLLSYLGRYDEAIEYYEQQLEETPENYTLLYNLAVASARQKTHPYSQKYITTARELLLEVLDSGEEEERGIVQYGLGGLEAICGNSYEALSYLQKAVVLNKSVIEWASQDAAWIDLRSDLQFQILISKKQ